jgi:hypothetical protein
MPPAGAICFLLIACNEASPDVLAAIGLKFLQYKKPDPEAD